MFERVKVSDQVDYSRVEGEIILLDIRLGKYYGLDSLASRIWESLAETKGMSSAIKSIVDDYGVSWRVVEQDVRQLLEQWLELGLIESGTPRSQAGDVGPPLCDVGGPEEGEQDVT